MHSELRNVMTVSQEAEARTKMKSEFELFSDPLPTEADLFTMWGDSHEVIVSIACATFNHGNLLNDAIRSFLLQKTGFRFEIVIRDDASTDGTHDLIAYYMQHYPRIVRARIYNENQFKLGRRPADDWIELTCGKYVALCEGDDFWIDRDKLQDQVAQLERHPDCVISVAGTLRYNVLDDERKETGLLGYERIYSMFPPKYHHTSTLVIEREALGKTTAKQKKYNLYTDMMLRRFLVDIGKCICLPRTVSVYWINGKGMWSSLGEEKQIKDRVLNRAGLIKVIGWRNKLSLLPDVFYYCARYFPIAFRNKEWGFVAACFIPFGMTKARNLSRRLIRVPSIKCGK
ncbi:glycosyltransferase family 2 protein [Roseovarius sp. D22-M7]|uniref:glycosyltransferase family 2 protein n=1 Tax=Roseovarius sp. D22-M7 TaxID=3127116 RepID=UPI0030104ACC